MDSWSFFRTDNGRLLGDAEQLKAPDRRVTSFAHGDPSQQTIGLGLDDGTVVIAQHNYQVSYPNDNRLITPSVFYPYEDKDIKLFEGQSVTRLTLQHSDEETTIVGTGENGLVKILSMMREESFLSDEIEITTTESEFPFSNQVRHIILDVDQRELYIADNEGYIHYYDISDKSEPRLIHRVEAVAANVDITSLKFLSGGISILVGDSLGNIKQWFPLRDENNQYTLVEVRGFDLGDQSISQISPEYFRKGFIAADTNGGLAIYHTTAHRKVKALDIGDDAILHMAVAPRANGLLIEATDQQLQFWHVDNEHPEISFSSIWGEVWYESRDKPEYIWQSSSASSDFEPKFSLTPLVFGTFKAAFYAMLFAVPMSICGAVYTAYFMSPKMRGFVKPTIEIMEALPTVILGFLAGLWFAPYLEKHMPGMFVLIVALPGSVILISYLWQWAPKHIRNRLAEGWEAALLIPVIILAIFVSMLISQPVEALFFDGNMPLWMTNTLGINFDQRNSLVVGIAMGFAVIPTIFSISEDAIYSVPKHLTTGSLALGATRWQTMVRVVILTASPGIFSAVMIGLGRAVGETMIVVMATGNTAIMDMNIFEGFRALSANIAVEMPESEVNSTHYRILFLAALVLFVVTFIFNTLAEIVRQHLRVKYSTL